MQRSVGTHISANRRSIGGGAQLQFNMARSVLLRFALPLFSFRDLLAWPLTRGSDHEPCWGSASRPQVFWSSYCQISTDLDKILHTPIVIRNTLWADLDRDRRVGGSRPDQNDYVFFCNTCSAP